VGEGAVAADPRVDALRGLLRQELASADVAAAGGLRWKLQGLRGGAAAYVLASLLLEADRPALVVTSGPRYAEELAAELRTILGERLDSSFPSRRVHVFPARETPVLEMVSAPLEVQAARVAALYQLASTKAPIVVTSPEALAVRTLRRDRLLESAVRLAVGDDVELEDLVYRFEELGYRRTGLVEEAGEYAVRGGIVDVWAAGSEYPARCELDGDTVESIRLFDPADQRSFGPAELLVVPPPTPFALAKLSDASVRRAVHARCNDLMLAAGERRQLDASLAAAAPFPGAELLLPYVYAESGPGWVGDYLPAEAITVVIDLPAVEAAIEDHDERLAVAEEAARSAGTFHPEIEGLYVQGAEVAALVTRTPSIELDYTEAVESSGKPGHRVWRIDARGNEPIRAARAEVKATRGDHRFRPMVDALEACRGGRTRTIVLAADGTQLARLEHLLALEGVERVGRAADFHGALDGPAEVLWLVQGALEEGFRLPAERLVVVTDEEIFGQRRRASHRRRVSRARAMTALAELVPGDYMVHVDHGIGIYRGLKHIAAGGTEADFIHLEYAGGDRYYLPVDRINLVEKYLGGGSGTPSLDKLGSSAWTRTKKRAKESILVLAKELLDLEAFRAVHARKPYSEPGADFEEFEAHFPFEETEGQQTAIDDITKDLTGEKPMDRVVCGDVGYGKTEVAMRAAYLAVMGGKQVAFLVPTTVLARQHYDTLRRRFDAYPVRVAMLSRFNTRAENEEIVAGLVAGSLDIVVGTHRLLQKDVSFARLGLLVVDEEHRFGVKAKERIKKMRREVDVLTMTATPIPRTLQLALTGVRDLSLIETPPVDRLAIRTYVARYDEGLIKQAIERELARGGQVFFVHNRVGSIAMIARRLRELVPKARIVIAHGQMNENDLDEVMVDFLEHESDVLVCTSIIESGLDIPNANTMLVNRADAFGLAQLYQIRGRVGRSHRRAYAYLLVPGERLISEDARRRLAVLQELDDLGSGFRLAAHDMEIRGAGNLLGKAQSGHVAAVGFDLFMQMMEEASSELRGQTPGPRVEPEIELGADAFIPESYIDDVGERLLIYKRMANAEAPSALAALAEELADRFGPLPAEVEDFVRIMALRPLLKALAVESLKASEHVVALRFHADSPVDRDELLRLATAEPERFRVRPGGVFTMNVTRGTWGRMVDEVERFLRSLLIRKGAKEAESRDVGHA
jgi:transcription-repair coupling factor (superfamily II helicase)